MITRRLPLLASSALPCVLAAVFLGTSSVPAFSQADIAAWIDPGHGDGCGPVGAPGTNGNAYPDEKDLTLLVGQKVVNRIGGLGYVALLTRNSDHCVSINDRPKIAAGLLENDDGIVASSFILVSIHMDGVKDTTTIGTFVIYPAPKMPFRKSKRAYREDSTLAGYIDGPLQSNAAAAFLGCYAAKPLRRDNRGLGVLRMARVPSALVECCTISNRCQFNNIVLNGDQGLIADGIATGISNFLGLGLVVPKPVVRSAPASTRPYTVVGPPRTLAGALQEGFEGVTFPPSGWTLESSGASPPYTWYRTTDPLYVEVGSAAVLVEGEDASAIDERLISPMFGVTSADSALRFRWLGNPTFASSVMGSCSVRRKGESTWTDVWALGQENAGLVYSFPSRTVSLRAWLGDSVQVSFRAVGTDGADFGIDDVATGVFPITGPPPNDLCQAATPLPAGAFSVSGSTCYAANNRDQTTSGGSSCVSDDAGGGDVFYSINALVDDTLRVHLDDASAAFTQLYLLSSCDSVTATCVAGEEASGGEIDSSLTYTFASAGTYYLVVDAMSSACGDFVLSGTWRGPVTAVPPQTSTATTWGLIARPNPARGVTVHFDRGRVALDGDGTLQIFDAAGRLVHERRVHIESAGVDLSWDGRGVTGRKVPSGRYLARVTIGGRSAVASFVFVN